MREIGFRQDGSSPLTASFSDPASFSGHLEGRRIGSFPSFIVLINFSFLEGSARFFIASLLDPGKTKQDSELSFAISSLLSTGSFFCIWRMGFSSKDRLPLAFG